MDNNLLDKNTIREKTQKELEKNIAIEKKKEPSLLERGAQSIKIVSPTLGFAAQEVVKLLENPEESQLKNLKKLKKETTKKQPLFTQQDDQFAFGEADIGYFSLSQEQRDAVLKAEKRQQNQNILDKFNKKFLERPENKLLKPSFGYDPDRDTLIPLTQIDSTDISTRTDFVYYPRSKKVGYILEDMNREEAKNEALKYYDYMKSTGSKFYTPDHEELNSLTRRMIEAQGDWNLIKDIIQDEEPLLFENALEQLNSNPAYDDVSEFTKRNIATNMAAARAGLYAVPSYLLTVGMRSSATIDMLLDVLPQFDGLFTSMFTTVANSAQRLEEGFEKAAEYDDNRILILDEDPYSTNQGDTIKIINPSYPYKNLYLSEVRGLLQDAEAPDTLTKAVRYFADDFGLSMGVITAVGKQSLNYYTRLSKIAERNLKNRGFNVKNIDPKIVFGEMKAIRNAQFEKLKANNKATIGKRIGKYFDETRLDYVKNPSKYMLEFGASEGFINLGFAGGENYLNLLKFGETEEGYENAFQGIIGAVFAGMTGQISVGIGLNKGRLLTKKVGILATRAANNIFSLDPTGTVDRALKYLEMKPEQLEARLKSSDPVLKANKNPELEKRLRAFLTRHVEFARDNPKEALVYLNALKRNRDLLQEAEDLGIIDKDQVILTLGQMAENDVMKAAEYYIGQNRTQATKMDKNFNFLLDSQTILKKKNSLQEQIDKTLSKLSAAELPTNSQLSIFRDLLQKKQAELAGDTKELESIIRNALVYDMYKIMDGVDLPTETATVIEEILTDNPALRKLLDSDDVKKQMQEIAPDFNLLKNINAKTILARKKYNTAIAEYKGLSEDNLIKYNENDVMEYKNPMTAQIIQGYTSKVGLTIAERLDDHYMFFHRNQYQKAFDGLDNIPDDLRTIDVSNLLFKVDMANREGVLKGDEYFRKKINQVVSPQLTSKLRANAAKLANILNQNGGQYDVDDVLQMVTQKALRTRQTAMGDRLLSPNTVSNIELLAVFDGFNKTKKFGGGEIFNTTVDVDVDNLVDFRKTTSHYERKYFKADAGKYEFYKDINKLHDEVFDNYLNYISTKGDAVKTIIQEGRDIEPPLMQLVNKLRKAETGFRKHRERLRNSDLYNMFLQFSERVDNDLYEGLSLTEKSNKAKEFMDGSFIPEGASLQGQYSGRKRNSNMPAENFFDQLFKRYDSPKSILDELEIFFGVKEGNRYRLPKPGEASYDSFKFFMKAMNDYVSARYAKGLDNLKAKGKQTLFEDKIKKYLNADFENYSITDLKNITKDLGVDNILKELDEDFIKKVTGLDDVIKRSYNDKDFNLAGSAMYEQVFKAAYLSPKVEESLSNLVTTIQKELKIKQPQYDAAAEKAKTLTKIANEIVSKGGAVYNAADFYKLAVKEMDEQGNSKFLDKIIEVAVENNAFGENTKEKAEAVIGNILSVGFQHTHTRKGKLKSWTEGKSAKELEEGDLNRTLDQTDDAKTKLGQDEKALNADINSMQKTSKNAPKFENEFFVDADTGIEELVKNKDFFVKYVNKGDSKNYKKLMVIFQLSRITRESGEQTARALNLVDPTHGNVKFGFNQAMSRIAAVYSGRASFRYPMAEMSFALMQKREADAISALLQADHEFVDLVFEVMLTGEVDPGKLKPRVVESFFVDMLALSPAYINSFLEGSHDISNDVIERDVISSLSDEALGINKIIPPPEPIEQDPSGLEEFIGSPRAAREASKYKKNVISYKAFLAKLVKDQMDKDEKLKFFDVLDATVKKLETVPFKEIQSTIKSLRR